MTNKQQTCITGVVPYILIRSIAMLDNVYECRLLGWVMAKAQSLAKNFDRNLAEINVQRSDINLIRLTLPARYLLPPNDHQYKNIDKAARLATKTIPYEHDGIIYNINIIAFPQIITKGREKFFSCVIHNVMWYALLDYSRGYRTINLEALIGLSTPAAMTMYILVSQQTNSINYSVDSLRNLLGATSDGYKRVNNFIARKIEPARRELNASAPYTYEYTCNKRGKQISSITITPKPNANYQAPNAERLRQILRKQRLSLDDDVITYMMRKFALTLEDVEHLEPILVATQGYNKERHLECLARIFEYTVGRNIKQPAAYLRVALTAF